MKERFDFAVVLTPRGFGTRQCRRRHERNRPAGMTLGLSAQLGRPQQCGSQWGPSLWVRALSPPRRRGRWEPLSAICVCQSLGISLLPPPPAHLELSISTPHPLHQVSCPVSPPSTTPPASPSPFPPTKGPDSFPLAASPAASPALPFLGICRREKVA